MLDLIVRNGLIHDGTGSDPFHGDVAVSGGRIVELGRLPATEVAEIDAADCVVAPGFIDIHSHSDYTLLVDPRAVSAIHQGVTLEVVGNCGFGCFPILDPELAQRAIYGYDDEVAITWSTAGGYLERLEAARPAVNVMSLVPNGQLRLASVGAENRPADRTELAEMQVLLRESLDHGAWGYSTGLEYAWEQGAPEEEVTALARLAPFYATHTRRRDSGAADAVAEALRVARATGVRLQVSHLIPRSGLVEGRACVELIDSSREEGADVAFDMHTRTFGLTHLYAALPAWALNANRNELARMLTDASARDQMRAHESVLSAGDDWSRVTLLDNPFWPEYSRRSIASIASERDQDAFDAVFDLLLGATDDMRRVMVTIHAYTETQQREAFVHPHCVPGSDATTLAPDGALADATFHGAYTWAAWYWRFMVTQHKLLSPAEAVRRLTGAPAERLGLSDRGVLRAGAHADIVVFDPERLAEQGTLFEPNVLATGMRHVLVNGVPTLRNGSLTGQRAGSVLRR